MGTSETGAVYYRGTCGHVWRVDRDQRPIGETRCPFCRAVAYAADTDGYPEHNPVVAERTALRAALSAAESARATAEARATQAEAELDRLRRDFPPAPPLAIAGCDCAACVRLRAMWAEPDVRTVPSVREAARRRMPLDGTDAQALEGAVTITEAERDEARAERDRLREALYDAAGRFALCDEDEGDDPTAWCAASATVDDTKRWRAALAPAPAQGEETPETPAYTIPLLPPDVPRPRTYGVGCAGAGYDED
jgi:hypothetical protein